MGLQQEQLTRFFQIIAASKLNAELEELTTDLLDSHWLSVNTGVADAKRTKPSILRGFLGAYNATTNTPALLNSTATGGDSYDVTVAGTHDFGAGAITMQVGDVIEFRNSIWKIRKSRCIVSSKMVKMGDTVAETIVDYINANDDASWNLLDNTSTIFTLIRNGFKESHLFVGTLPKYLGVSNEAALVADFELIHAGRLFIENCQVEKGFGNDGETAIEINDIVYYKDVTFNGITITLVGWKYNGGDTSLKASYTKEKSIA